MINKILLILLFSHYCSCYRNPYVRLYPGSCARIPTSADITEDINYYYSVENVDKIMVGAFRPNFRPAHILNPNGFILLINGTNCIFCAPEFLMVDRTVSFRIKYSGADINYTFISSNNILDYKIENEVILDEDIFHENVHLDSEGHYYVEKEKYQHLYNRVNDSSISAAAYGKDENHNTIYQGIFYYQSSAPPKSDKYFQVILGSTNVEFFLPDNSRRYVVNYVLFDKDDKFLKTSQFYIYNYQKIITKSSVGSIDFSGMEYLNKNKMICDIRMTIDEKIYLKYDGIQKKWSIQNVPSSDFEKYGIIADNTQLTFNNKNLRYGVIELIIKILRNENAYYEYSYEKYIYQFATGKIYSHDETFFRHHFNDNKPPVAQVIYDGTIFDDSKPTPTIIIAGLTMGFLIIGTILWFVIERKRAPNSEVDLKASKRPLVVNVSLL